MKVTKRNRLLAALLALVMVFGLLPMGALAEDDHNNIEISEYHLMNRQAFQQYYADKIKEAHPKAWGILLNGIRIYADSAEDVGTDRQANPGSNYYNVYAGESGNLGNKIQPDEVDHITLYGTYAWGDDSVTISRDELDFVLYDAQSDTSAYAEVYFKGQSPEVPDTCDVTFDLGYDPDDDTARTAVQTVEAGGTVEAPASLERDGYRFLGWFEEGAEESFDFTTAIIDDLTLTARWEENIPAKDAWFFIRTDGLVPMENGNTTYPGNQYLPGHKAKNALTGTVTKESAWTSNYGYIEGDALNGKKLSEAFAEVMDAIAVQPSTADIETALSSINYDPETQGVIWYVIKSNSDGAPCPGNHVDGVVYTKGSNPTEVRVLNYFNNIPGEQDALLAYSVHGLGTEATVGQLVPTREGYDFTGWNTVKDGSGSPYTAGSSITMDTDYSLYAQWKPQEYKVAYRWTGAPSSETIPAEAIVTYGGSYTVDSTHTAGKTIKADGGTYTFSGWNRTGTITVNSDTILTGSWSFVKDPEPPVEQKTTKVGIWHYYIDGTQTQDYSEDLAAENALGENGIVARDDMRITKAYVDGLSTLSFYGNVNGRDLAYTSHSIWAFYDDGRTSVQVAPGPDGYVDLTDVKELRIHLNYYQTLYKVTYDANGGVGADGKVSFTKSYNTASGYTILDNAGAGTPSFTRTGYTFAGWAKDASGNDMIAVGASGTALKRGETVTYYAQWTKNEIPTPDTYTVTYQYTGSVPSGVTPPTDSAAYEAEALVSLAAAPTAPANYTFAGWTLPEGLTLQDGKFPMPADNIIIYGNWTYTAPSGGGDSTPNYRTITVNYLEQDTNEVLAESVSIRLTYGSRYDVTREAALSIDGYTLASVNGDTTGTLKHNTAVNVYYTASDNTIEVPDDETPLGPGPDAGDTEVPDGEIPLAPLPGAGDTGDVGAGSGAGDGTIIVDENVPLGDLPQTGTTAEPVNAALTLGLLALCASLAAAGLTITLSRKKENDG